jgi:pimeloyl-ACP methyl ester carboxylesterase
MLRRMARAPRGVVQLAVNRRLVRSPLAALIFGDPTKVPADVLLADMLAMGSASGFERLAHVGRDYAFASPAPTVPVTVAWGTRDRILWPSQARTAARLLPGARHVSLDRCGHVPMSDAPQQVAELILGTCASSTVDNTRAA